MKPKPPKELWVNVYGNDDICPYVSAVDADVAQQHDLECVTAHYRLVAPKRQVRAYVVRRVYTEEPLVYEYQDPAGCWTQDRYFADRYTPDRHESAQEDAEAVTKMDSDMPPARVVRIVKAGT